MAKLVIELEDGSPWKASRHQQGESKSSAYVRMMYACKKAIDARLSGKDGGADPPKPESLLQSLVKRGPGRPRKNPL